MIKNLYPPVNYSPGQELAPSTPCRVASGSSSLISRRFFINQNPCEGKLIMVLLPNNVSNIW
jgi:hypothetical protein